MKSLHPDYKLSYRAGYYIEKHQLRHENEAGAIVAIAVMAALATILLAISLPSCAQAEVYDSSDICDAIYVIEGAEKTRHPYGILSVPCNGEADCRDVCLNTVENTFTSWQADGSQGDFLEALARRYAPVNSDTDNGTNQYWLKNVKYYLAKEK